jgi:hypothetical protein
VIQSRRDVAVTPPAEKLSSEVSDFMARNPVCAIYGNHLVLSGKPCWQTPFRTCQFSQAAKSNPIGKSCGIPAFVRYLGINGEVSSERLS